MVQDVYRLGQVGQTALRGVQGDGEGMWLNGKEATH
jgi:hypothetical protein